MKAIFFFLALFVVAQALTDKQKELLRNHGKLCIQESGVERDNVLKLRKGDYSLDDGKLNDFCLCMLKKSELVDADGKFNKEVALRKVGEDVRVKVSNALDKCIKPDVVVTPEVAWSYAKCYHAERPNHDIF